MKVLILGHTGMLGNAVQRYFQKMGTEVELLPEGMRWPSAAMEKHILASSAEVVINCIGAIPQKSPEHRQLFELNTRLPLFLFTLTSKTILHAATDCEFAGDISADDFYGEDDHLDAKDLYGISKSIPAEFIKRSSMPHVKMIRASIVGIEAHTHFSLLNWFLLQVQEGKPVTGYTNHYWNGITTLEWAKTAFAIIQGKQSGNIFQVASEKVSKYQLLRHMADVFSPGCTIAEGTHSSYHNKCLASKGEIRNIEIMLRELKEFYAL